MMPLILNNKVNNSTSLGVWKIIETVGSMKKLLELDENDKNYLGTFGNELRMKHWLSYRLILQELMPIKNLKIIYDEYGKPIIPNFSGYFSVSHSGDFAAAIVSYEMDVGIDIEKIRERIERVAERFLSIEEQEQAGIANRLEKLHIFWGAKESLYKMYGKPEVDFQTDIRIEPFDYFCIGEGACQATMKTPEGLGSYTIFYRNIENYMLVWAIGHSQFAIRHTSFSKH